VKQEYFASGMMEATKGFRRLKAYKQLPALRAALQADRDCLTEKPIAPAIRAA
jgi:putative transposase